MGVLQDALSCVSHAIWYVAPRYRGAADEMALLLSEDRPRLRTADGLHVFFSAGQYFHFSEDDRPGREWWVEEDGYAYSIYVGADPAQELLSWHWHPDSRPGTHLHAIAAHRSFGPVDKLHLPTGRVAFEAVVRFLIEDLGVTPIRQEWDSILSGAEERVRTFRRWH